MRRKCLRKTQVSLTLVVALMLLASPAAASPAFGPASPGSAWSLAVAKVLNAFAGLWGVVAPDIAALPAPGARAKDGDDREGVGTLPLDELGEITDPHG